MKKFIIRILILIAIIVVVDLSVGSLFAYMEKHAKGGYIGHHNYITDKTHEDVLVFGSSRAIHHYNPQIIQDSLNFSCYNCGQDGNGIILFYGWWQLIKERYTPSVIIYDLAPGFDLFIGDDNHRYLGWLKGSHEQKCINEIFDYIDATEKYKMISHLYRYNSQFMQIIVDYFHPLYAISENGFLPLYGELDSMRVHNPHEPAVHMVDSVKLHFMNAFIEQTKDIRLVFVVSPDYTGGDTTQHAFFKELCSKNGIPFLDYSNNPKYVHNTDYFVDGAHLNALGADEFTRDITQQLKQ